MQHKDKLDDDVENNLDLLLTEFDQTLHHLTRDIYRISSDNSKMSKLAEKLGGPEDSHDIRAQLNATLETNKESIRKEDQKLRLKNVLREFQPAMETFQRLQQLTVKKSEEFVSQAQVLTETEPAIEGENSGLLESGLRQELIAKTDKQLTNEISYNQAVILERQQGIKEIQSAMNEVNIIFKDISMLVCEQQDAFDNIAVNVELASSRTRQAVGQLRIAEDYRRRRRWSGCWTIIFAIIVTFIIIALIIS